MVFCVRFNRAVELIVGFPRPYRAIYSRDAGVVSYIQSLTFGFFAYFSMFRVLSPPSDRSGGDRLPGL